MTETGAAEKIANGLVSVEGDSSPYALMTGIFLLTVAATALILTPVATPGNMMVMGPGGYKFGDCSKLGLQMVLWYFMVVMALVPLIWSF